MVERELPIKDVMFIQDKNVAFGDVTFRTETNGLVKLDYKITKGTLRLGISDKSDILAKYDVLTDGQIPPHD
jgi:hypothetical protein